MDRNAVLRLQECNGVVKLLERNMKKEQGFKIPVEEFKVENDCLKSLEVR